MRSRAIDWEPINGRMCRLRIKYRFYNYHIFKVHCPHGESTDAEQEAFYAELKQNFDSCPQRNVKIIIGWVETYKPVVGSNSLHTVTNYNGQRCIDFAASRGMVVRNTLFPRKDIHKVTWTSPNQRTKTQIEPPFNTERLQDTVVAQHCVQQLEARLPTEKELGAASINDGWS
ncbi:craniofacial development protein 2-like [Culex pipiens pallens]|uniref:craniofacial development protein 2-like n=1 Tax=Culex pipiens pallens TaxID=42434 RepID=UPI001953FFC3|nr:craniofacial development protein 2-like [Culex pipiens pallens]